MKFAKDNTVLGSLVVVGIGIMLGVAGLLPESGNGQPWYIVTAMFLIWLAAFRLMLVLPVQTLIHSVKHDPADKRVTWVWIHVLLWPFAGLAYYFRVKNIKPDSA